MADSDSLPPVPTGSLCSPGRYRPCARSFASSGPGRGPRGPGHLLAGLPLVGVARTETSGSPRFPGGPLARMPRSSTPAGPRRSGHCDRAASPSGNVTPSAPAIVTFGARSRGLRTRCLRFAAWVAPGPRKTRFRLAANLGRAGLATRRTPQGGFERRLCFRHLILLLQAWPGARHG